MSYKDYGKQDWLKVLGITDEKVPELLVIEGSNLMQRRLAERQKLLTNPTTIRYPNIIAGEANGKRVAYACAYGAPFAAELVHVLCASGTRKVVLIGCCGGLQRSIKMGDVIIPDSIHGEEGVSSEYLGGFHDVEATPALVKEIADQCTRRNLRYHIGPFVTFEAVIAETREHVRRWGSSGYLGVDMEAAAIFAVAKYFGADRAAMLPAADLVVEGRTFLDTVEEDERLNLEKARNSMAEIAFGL